ncbi:MAG: phosphate ABC transporter permease [Coleofasciculaceae cyanobacterium]
MLIPITREKFEEVVPLLATGPQYAYYWGKFPDFLKRVLISVLAVVIILLFKLLFSGGFSEGLSLSAGIIGGLYWLWGPVYWATIRNSQVRRNKYAGFWRGRVLDVFVTEDLVGKEETVNQKGELVIVENRERRVNVEVGDETGFTTLLQAPLRRLHKGINPGQLAEMLVMSNQSDLGRIAQTSDIHIPRLNLWVSDYPYLRRDEFIQVSAQLRGRPREKDSRAERIVNTKRRRRG